MKTKVLSPILVTLFVALMAFSANAQGGSLHTHEDAGISFSSPKDWKVETEGDMLSVYSPDESVAVTFFVTDHSGLEQLLEALGDELGKLISDTELGEVQEMKLNGLTAFYVDGDGVVEGTEVSFGVIIIKAKKPVMIVGIAEPDTYNRYADQMRSLFGSIKAVE